MTQDYKELVKILFKLRTTREVEQNLLKALEEV